MELDTTLLNTQHYKVRFKGKVEQSRDMEVAPSPTPWCVVAIEKGAFGSPSTMDMKKSLKKKKNPNLMNLLCKSTWNVLIVITFFRTLNS